MFGLAVLKVNEWCVWYKKTSQKQRFLAKIFCRHYLSVYLNGQLIQSKEVNHIELFNIYVFFNDTVTVWSIAQNISQSVSEFIFNSQGHTNLIRKSFGFKNRFLTISWCMVPLAWKVINIQSYFLTFRLWGNLFLIQWSAIFYVLVEVNNPVSLVSLAKRVIIFMQVQISNVTVRSNRRWPLI